MLCMGTACDAMLRGRAQQMDAARRARTQATLDGVRRGLEALRPIHGRKSLLLVSQGFISDSQDSGQRAVVALSREANTARLLPGRARSHGHARVRDRVRGRPGPGPGVVMETVLADRGAVAFEQSVLESTGSEGPGLRHRRLLGSEHE